MYLCMGCMELITATVLCALSPASELSVSVRRTDGQDPDPTGYWRFCYPDESGITPRGVSILIHKNMVALPVAPRHLGQTGHYPSCFSDQKKYSKK